MYKLLSVGLSRPALVAEIPVTVAPNDYMERQKHQMHFVADMINQECGSLSLPLFVLMTEVCCLCRVLQLLPRVVSEHMSHVAKGWYSLSLAKGDLFVYESSRIKRFMTVLRFMLENEYVYANAQERIFLHAHCTESICICCSHWNNMWKSWSSTQHVLLK